ncbi:MAG: DUF4231 domain-containing protein [bacterium]|nr:DUF4231 domain-containing protein [bacterium]
MADGDYSAWLRGEFGKMIDMLDLSDLQKHYINNRWLDQVIWMENKAGQSRDRYYRLRLITIVGGAVVPALVGLNANDGTIIGAITISTTVYWLIFTISLAVAISGALDEFFRYSDRWRHYRSIVEELKIIGWQYFQLSGRFKDFTNHKAGYITFVDTVEGIMQKEVEIYVSSVSREQKKQEDEDNAVQGQTNAVATADAPADESERERAPLFN